MEQDSWKRYSLGNKDRSVLEKSGITEKNFFAQIEKFYRGNIPVELVKPAVKDDGIISLSQNRKEDLVELFRLNCKTLDILKFVPASGAASRMFKTLFKLRGQLKNGEITPGSINSKVNHTSDIKFFMDFISGLKKKKFPFFSFLKDSLKNKGHEIEEAISKKKYELILDHLLGEENLNYNLIPKALLNFHHYSDGPVTPLSEHLLEASLYAVGKNSEANIHFTVSEDALGEITSFTENLKSKFTEKNISVRISFSTQSKSTNTIAVDSFNIPARDENSNILLRPGGHGALINNLNSLDADIIFIKNIDNITSKEKLEETIENKFLLGGLLINIQEKIFGFHQSLPKISRDSELINEIYCYSKDILNIPLPDEFPDLELAKKKELLQESLNRPVRVCGVVKNEGEPGGGPFWIKDEEERTTLQIVESAQIDLSSEHQKSIFEKSLFFNPVDLACGVRNYKGEKFDLFDFIEENRYFITEKFYNGEKIKALEHPGLWNGAMGKWITVFVEVPISAFNPVKTVNDLLKETHQPAEGTSFFNG